MSLLDDIGKKRVDVGRTLCPETGQIEYVDWGTYNDYRKKREYDLWFSISVDNFDEDKCLDLLDLLSGVRNIAGVSALYILKQYSFDPVTERSVYVGIKPDIRTLKDCIKLLWSVSSVMWESFGNVGKDVDVCWMSEFDESLRMVVQFKDFLKTMKKFDADKHHNNLSDGKKSASILHHLIRRPIGKEESRQMVRWCKKCQMDIVDVYLKKMKG